MTLVRIALRSSAVGAAGLGGALTWRRYRKQQCVHGDVNVSALPSRALCVEKMKNNRFDVVVVGGGAAGAAIALDAATRGLSCAVLEKNDFGGGTSSRSTKLVHGGIRYLEAAVKTFDKEQFKLVVEALEERAHMIKAAPFLCRPLPALVPIYKAYEVPYIWFGVKTYDWLAKLVCSFDTGVPGSYFASKSNTLFQLPLLRAEHLKGSIVYYDGQHNDARMNLLMLLTATQDNYISGFRGAVVANHCAVTSFVKDDSGKVEGVQAVDATSGEKITVYGKTVVNATGPHVDEIRKLADPLCDQRIMFSRGAHLALPRFFAGGMGLVVPKTADGRVMFCLPWENSTILGTTDTADQLTFEPKACVDDIEEIVKEATGVMDVTPETFRNYVGSCWAGLRPLIKPKVVGDSLKSSEVTRGHEVVIDSSGLVTVMGGKWTTSRSMAKEAMDELLKTADGKIEAKHPCRTLYLPLLGSRPLKESQDKSEIERGAYKLSIKLMQAHPTLSFEQADHLARNYGFRAWQVCDLAAETETLKPLVPNHPYLKAEILYATRNEMAMTPSDVLGRRLSLAHIDSDLAELAGGTVISLMQEEFGWNESEVSKAQADMRSLLSMTRPASE